MREPSNAALERLAHATTDKGHSPASLLQALVRSAEELISSLIHFAASRPFLFGAKNAWSMIE